MDTIPDENAMIKIAIKNMVQPNATKEEVIENGTYVYLTILKQEIDYNLKTKKNISNDYIDEVLMTLKVFFRRIYPKEFDDRKKEMYDFIKSTKNNYNRLKKLYKLVVILIAENGFLACRRYKKSFWEKTGLTIKGKTPFLEGQIEALRR